VIFGLENESMQSKKNNIVRFLIIAALYPGCFFITGCENDQKQIEALTKNKVLIEEARNMEAYLSQEGIIKAKLKSPIMLHYEKDTSFAEFPNTLHVDFFDSTAKIESWLDSKYGKYFESQNKVFLRDSVVAISVKGDTLHTTELWWDQKKEKFYTEKEYQLNTKTQKIHGLKGLEATQDFKEITFNEPAGTVKVSDNGLPQ
jgi:lipopolysaccharide export system protein LptC